MAKGMGTSEGKEKAEAAPICPIKRLMRPRVIPSGRRLEALVPSAISTIGCDRDQCAWWLQNYEECGIKVLAICAMEAIEKWEILDERKGNW